MICIVYIHQYPYLELHNFEIKPTEFDMADYKLHRQRRHNINKDLFETVFRRLKDELSEDLIEWGVPAPEDILVPIRGKRQPSIALLKKRVIDGKATAEEIALVHDLVSTIKLTESVEASATESVVQASVTVPLTRTTDNDDDEDYVEHDQASSATPVDRTHLHRNASGNGHQVGNYAEDSGSEASEDSGSEASEDSGSEALEDSASEVEIVEKNLIQKLYEHVGPGYISQKVHVTDVCTICLGPMGDNQEITRVCGHHWMHIGCIVQYWQKKKAPRCPTCNTYGIPVCAIAVDPIEEVTKTNGSVSTVKFTEVGTQIDESVSVGGACSNLLSTEDKQTRYENLGYLQKQVNEAKIKEKKASDDNIKLRAEKNRLETHCRNLSNENEALKRKIEEENVEDDESPKKFTRSNLYL
jgi:hypothetical protein